MKTALGMHPERCPQPCTPTEMHTKVTRFCANMCADRLPFFDLQKIQPMPLRTPCLLGLARCELSPVRTRASHATHHR